MSVAKKCYMLKNQIESKQPYIVQEPLCEIKQLYSKYAQI